MRTERFPGPQTTTVFYPNRRGVAVTDRDFTAFGRRFRIDGLTDVVWGRGSAQNARRTAVRLVAVETLIATIMIVMAPTIVAILLTLGYLVFAAAMISFALLRWPTPLELWADYDDEPVLLFSATNRTEFGQVQRALMRALEFRDARYGR